MSLFIVSIDVLALDIHPPMLGTRTGESKDLT